MSFVSSVYFVATILALVWMVRNFWKEIVFFNVILDLLELF